MRYSSRSPTSAASTAAHVETLGARQAATYTCLPQTLLSVLPNCAVSCIQSFASSSYPGASCADTSDLNFLCSKPNTSGLALGEKSVQCVVSFCTGQDQVNVASYNVCHDIAGALPNTASTITATLFGTVSTSPTSSMDTLPATVGLPTSTQSVSMIVMATTSPSPPPPPETSATPAPASPSSGSESPSSNSTTMSTTTSSSSSSSMSPEQTSGVTAQADQSSTDNGLTTPAIAGIAIGGAALIAVGIALVLLWLWMRRRRRERRRSQRRSRMVESALPPDYQSPPKKDSATFGSILAVPNGHGRFYASTPPEDKRRSFWRRSILPDQIGVAVSPKMHAQRSPTSATSEQSFARLLRSPSAAALKPAPLDLESVRGRNRTTWRTASLVTYFDDEPLGTHQSEQVVVDDQPFILERPPLAKRARGPPPMLELPKVPQSPPKVDSARIPLTPTYDNGNIQFAPPTREYSSPPTTQGPLPAAEHKLPASSAYASRNLLRKKNAQELPLRADISPPLESLAQPREPPRPPQSRPAILQAATWLSQGTATNKHDSLSTDYTEFDEDTSPEEVIKELGSTTSSSAPLMASSRRPNVPPSLASPIKDLRYPEVPRSAAVSKQAERAAQPRTGLNLLPSALPDMPGSRSTRDQLVRAEASFMQTDTTSSDGYLSDDALEFPAPPSSLVSATKSNLSQLRNNASSGNKQPFPYVTASSLNAALAASGKKEVAVPERTPSTKARVTPSKSRTGDLYLRVEI